MPVTPCLPLIQPRYPRASPAVLTKAQTQPQRLRRGKAQPQPPTRCRGVRDGAGPGLLTLLPPPQCSPSRLDHGPFPSHSLRNRVCEGHAGSPCSPGTPFFLSIHPPPLVLLSSVQQYSGRPAALDRGLPAVNPNLNYTTFLGLLSPQTHSSLRSPTSSQLPKPRINFRPPQAPL